MTRIEIEVLKQVLQDISEVEYDMVKKPPYCIEDAEKLRRSRKRIEIILNNNKHLNINK